MLKCKTLESQNKDFRSIFANSKLGSKALRSREVSGGVV